MFLGCKNTTNIVHIQILAGNKREFNYIFLHNQPKVIIIEVDSLVILQSAAHSGLLELPTSAGVTLRSPPACGLPALWASLKAKELIVNENDKEKQTSYQNETSYQNQNENEN